MKANLSTSTLFQVLDVRHGQRVEVKETEQMTPTAFIFLYENQLFLTFKHRTVAVWNFRVRLQEDGHHATSRRLLVGDYVLHEMALRFW